MKPKILLKIVVVAVAVSTVTGCTCLARFWTEHVSHTTDLEQYQPPPDPTNFSPLPH